MKARLVVYAVGTGLVAIGGYGILTTASVGPFGWALWFAGVAVAHDFLLVPVVMAVGLLMRRTVEPYRSCLATTLIIMGAVTVVALPLVLGFGKRPDNLSQLPLNYPLNLVLVLLVIAAISTVVLALRVKGPVERRK
ncbi:hypothetical protein N5079_33415 [Planotetraspora sp. A-T 1434]|uniref:hypothetical protein n=1 Tax=Planotetraspora sp. A-T 1434 TaxID=2979219 RepID=UPI0021C05C98|nr:hypothetical protein [Planotetraspora sp. A-T 1434]MCT9935112.1 hypothetical protein [Planotetraspora sp. A-T 1434]